MMRFKALITIALLSFVGHKVAFASDPKPVSEVEARVFVKDVGEKIVAILQDKGTALDVRKEQFRGVLRQHFELPSIGRFVLGRYWRQASDAQQKDYLILFENDLVESYSAQFDAYNDETFEVIGHRPSQDGGVVIKSRINRTSGGEPLPVDWKVFETPKGLRVFDIIVNGVSMSITQRTDYAGLMASAKSMDAFLAQLRTKQKAPTKVGQKAAS
ncbi:MAG: phospholipid-binding protein MlaC [Holosporales bacterium]